MLQATVDFVIKVLKTRPHSPHSSSSRSSTHAICPIPLSGVVPQGQQLLARRRAVEPGGADPAGVPGNPVVARVADAVPEGRDAHGRGGVAGARVAPQAAVRHPVAVRVHPPAPHPPLPGEVEVHRGHRGGAQRPLYRDDLLHVALEVAPKHQVPVGGHRGGEAGHLHALPDPPVGVRPGLAHRVHPPADHHPLVVEVGVHPGPGGAGGPPRGPIQSVVKHPPGGQAHRLQADPGVLPKAVQDSAGRDRRLHHHEEGHRRGQDGRRLRHVVPARRRDPAVHPVVAKAVDIPCVQPQSNLAVVQPGLGQAHVVNRSRKARPCPLRQSCTLPLAEIHRVRPLDRGVPGRAGLAAAYPHLHYTMVDPVSHNRVQPVPRLRCPRRPGRWKRPVVRREDHPGAGVDLPHAVRIRHKQPGVVLGQGNRVREVYHRPIRYKRRHLRR
eukprot:768787-Hanusia_phi.AAC.8